VVHQAVGYPDFCSMKRLGVFLPPSPDGMLVHRRVTPALTLPAPIYNTWMERSTGRVKCLVENKTQSPWSGLELGPQSGSLRRRVHYNHVTSFPGRGCIIMMPLCLPPLWTSQTRFLEHDIHDVASLTLIQ